MLLQMAEILPEKRSHLSLPDSAVRVQVEILLALEMVHSHVHLFPLGINCNGGDWYGFPSGVTFVPLNRDPAFTTLWVLQSLRSMYISPGGTFISCIKYG